MSYVYALPEVVSAAATDVASIGSVVATANQGMAAATTEVLAAAQDEVSAAISAFFSAHGQGYQAFSAQAATFHAEFVRALNSAAGSYASAEAAGASVLQGFEAAGQEILQAPANVATGFARVANYFFTEIVGAPAAPPFPATEAGTFTGVPSIINRLETAALYPVKPLLALSGLETGISMPNNPLLQLLASDVPPLSWFIGNSPPPFLNLRLGETVQFYSSDGMRIVQITPMNPTGENVVAIHGGAFIFPPSFLHWIHYSVMAHQTGATIQVPIYPLLQEGGTAGLVVPQLASFINSQVTAHGAANVSVIGDSAGGNLALAAVNRMVGLGNPVPSRMVLLSPWLDLTMTNPNIAFVQDPLLPWGPAMQIGKVWAGGLPVTDPLVSPLYGTNFAGLPPTFVYSGNLDILSPDVFRLQERAVAQLAPISFVLANGQIHDWLILTLDGLRYWPQINQQLGIAA
ncbi:lipase [Mycobacterium intermedium]|uniref:Lipase n=1 Tax=Mycobacterium intermedium TaxID=28445 RepID=A0A1E3SC06_MYCIE|nr:PE domain-containing protein [Mycobacterium intermedium]MCV6966858.1 PE domain-containing protein [Mycobacterium intermedium]ODQ99696.1 lipase [Mycobacterium intermedium]OPE48576.1 lipase [Mycobacterium intermedium]ORB07202.1 lipase [Mycobacterium intermedium]